MIIMNLRPLPIKITQIILVKIVAISCGYSTCFAVRTCDGLCHLIFSMDRVGIPFGFQAIIWTFVRHTVSRCLTFPAPKVTWLGLDQSQALLHIIGSFQFLPTGLHGLCFGCCFSGPLPLRSLINGPPIGVLFRKFPVIRLHSEIDQIHLGIEAWCVTTLLPLTATYIRMPRHLQLSAHPPKFLQSVRDHPSGESKVLGLSSIPDNMTIY